MTRTLVAGAKPTQRTLVTPAPAPLERHVAKDARTDQAMVQILFQVAELLSQFRRWHRTRQALERKLDDPKLDSHPRRPDAIKRWEQAMDWAAEIQLDLWNLAAAAATAWTSYSPARRGDLSQGGEWPPVEAPVEEATGFFRDEFLLLAWKGALKQ